MFCAAIAGALAFAANIASAVPGYFNISGTATADKYTVTTTGFNYKFDKHSFSTKDVLTFLANATGQLWISNKNSHLVYDIDAYNDAASNWYGEGVHGIFWVTNTTSHAIYRLDNSDTGTTYWSYIELDYDKGTLGFWDPYNLTDNTPVGENYAENYVEVTSPYKSAGKELGSDAILYVHDNPARFDYLDYGGWVLFDNTNSLVIRGPITVTWSNTSLHSSASISLQGSGDGYFYVSGTGYISPVMTGKATYSGKN